MRQRRAMDLAANICAAIRRLIEAIEKAID
jgi:hypothetical protein